LGEKTWLIIIIKLNFVQVFGDAKMTMASLGHMTQHGDILEAGNDFCRFKQRKK
jgi:hypothetical protein